MAAVTPTYAYEFDDVTAPTYLPPVSFNVAAGHTTEIQYLFPGYHGGAGIEHKLNPLQEQLSDRMVGYWTHFAHTGEPGGNWRPYTRNEQSVQALLLGKPVPTLTFPREHNCGFWTQLEDWPSAL